MDPPSEMPALDDEKYNEQFQGLTDEAPRAPIRSSNFQQWKLSNLLGTREFCSNDHSLPTPEEVRMDALVSGNSSNPYSGHRKRLLYFLSIGATIFMIILFAAGAKRRSSSSSPPPADSDPWIGEIGPLTPLDQRVANLAYYIIDEITDREYVELIGSPQFRALQWIAMFDRMQLEVPTNDDEALIFRERYAMAVLYYSLQGENWELPMRFMTERSVCDWNILMSAGTSERILGVTCDEDGAIVDLFFPGNNLVGEIPAEIGVLESLQRISFYDNLIAGELPADMMFLSNLAVLSIESNLLSGSIPSWINKLTSLEYLALGDNQLTGTIPNLSGLTSLKELALDQNSLSGDVENLNTATGLQSIFLNKNLLDGRVHGGLFADLFDLDVLDLSDNVLTGYVPQLFYSYRIVDLHNNRLSGDLPDVTLPDLPLEFLSVHHNQIRGEIPESFGALTALRYLDLSDNEITGRLSDSLNNLSNMEFLFLGRNPMTEGRIPFLGSLTGLIDLSLAGTNRNGMIPTWIDQLENLVLLDLQDNQLSGPIPDQLGNLEKLTYLMLNANRLYGELPSSLANLQNLVTFFVDKNELTGSAGAICLEGIGPEGLSSFITDCDVYCECCDMCCRKGDTCYDIELAITAGPGYTRDQSIFGENVKLVLESRSSF